MVTLSDESRLRTHVRSTLGIKHMLEEHMRGNDAMLLLTTSLTGIDRTESIVGVHVAQFREDGLFGCLPMLAVESSRNRDIVRRQSSSGSPASAGSGGGSITRSVVASDRGTED